MQKSEELFKKVVSSFFPEEKEQSVERLLKRCSDERISFLPIPENSLLKTIYSPPPLLFYRGNFELLHEKNFGVVGSRYPGQTSIAASLHFSRAMAKENFCITSGLARGIDSYAHLGALQAKGKTIAVLGCGLDQIYPKENLRLADRIVGEGGLLLSEYPPTVPPLKHHFPRRNRIIAGIAQGVLVIEANQKSGSLITAQFAADENRDLFVLPGEWQDVKFSGSHSLIRQGAHLVTEPKDILNFYGIEKKENTKTSALQKFFVEGVNELSDIWSRSGLSITELSEVLAIAVLEEQITEISPQQYLYNY